MRLQHTFIALSFIATLITALSACTAAQDKSTHTTPAREPAPATPTKVGDAMGSPSVPANHDPYFTPTAAKSTSSMPRVIIRNIREDRAGNIWFATFGGPIRYDGKEFTNFSEEVGLAKRRIFSLLEDRSGALWFGSITGGASRYDGKSFTKFTEKEGLGNNDVMWTFEDRDANVWFGTGNGASRYDGESMTNFTTKEGLVHNSVYTIAQDASGRIWFGTQGGICSYDGKSFSNLAEQVGRSFVNIRSMVVDRSGNLWFGGQEGAFRYDGKTLTAFTSKEGLLDDFVGSMIVDRAGNLWLGHPGRFPGGSGGGASHYDGKSFKHFTQKDGLGSLTVYAMLEDKAGNIWFGSADAGVSRYDGKTFTNFSATTPPLFPAKPAQAPTTPTKVADPMASFARLVGGEWQVTFTNGTSAFHAWQWGPGKHSMRKMTDGSDAVGKAWAGEVMYWHPGRKQVCVLSMHGDIPGVGRGVSEGTIKFEGETTDGVLDLYQPRGRRKLGQHQTFEGSDKYHETLLEDAGAGLKPLAEWDFVRIKDRSVARPRSAKEAPNLPEHLKAFEPLLSRTWNTRGETKGFWGGNTANVFHIETTFEWVPLANAIYARSFALRGNGSPTHMLDAYFYHHTGTGRLRCLALWSLQKGEGGNGLYEGDVTVLEGEGGGGGAGALELDLKGYEGDRVVPYTVRFDFEKDGTLHQRAWSLDAAPGGSERTLMLDAHHSASKMSKSILTVFQDSKKNYWFGSDVQGVYRYDGTTITNFSTKDGLCDDRVRGIQEDNTGNLYFTTSNGISKFDGQTFRTLTPVRSDPPDKEWKMEPNDLWFPAGQNAGVVCRYDGITLHGLSFPTTKLGDEHYTQYPRSRYPNMRYSPYDVYSIFKDSKGNVWFGTGTGTGMLGACRYDGTSFTWISSDELGFGGSAFCVRSIAEDKDGKFWFSNTMNRFDVQPNGPAAQEQGPVTFRKEKVLGHAEDDFTGFMSSTKDDHGDLWMATYGAGVWRYDGEHMTHYPVQDGERPVTLFSIYRDHQGVLWLGTHEAGAYRFNGKTFDKFRP